MGARPAAKDLKFSASYTSASGIILHIWGWYKTLKGLRLSGSEACFGIVNPENSKVNPSNAETRSVIGKADKSQADKGRVDVIVEKRLQILKAEVFVHEKVN